MKEKILVLGGAGFIGINMLYKLYNQKKYKIISIDNLNYASNVSDKIFKKIKNYRINISNKKSLEKLVLKFKPDKIINFAAETHVDRSIDNPDSFIKTNIQGVYNILEICRKKNKIKFIHISTDEVYGDIKKGKFSKENDPYNPTSPYAATKACSDLLIKSFVKTYKISALITNCCNNFGPYQYPEKFIPRSILTAISNKPIEIYGNGKNEREWIHVDDHCEAILKLMKKKNSFGQTYNIGSGVIKSNIEVSKIILKILSKLLKKKLTIKFVKDRPSHDIRYALNSKKIQKHLNWKCKTSFEEGMIQTVLWYLNSKWKNKRNDKSFTKRLGLNA